MRKQIEMYNQGLREFEERQRPYRAGLSERGSNNGGPGSQSANGTNDHSQSLEVRKQFSIFVGKIILNL